MMIKKLKKLISMVAGISMLACSLASCGGAATPGKPKDVSKDVTQDDFEIDGSTMNASEWAYKTYSLSEFEGEKVTIDFSCEMKVVNAAGTDQKLMWQVNTNGTYPEVVTHTFTSADTDWVEVKGSNADEIEVASGALLYLSTYETDMANLKISVRNIKYTVKYTTTSGGDDEPDVEYPTDIFTVGEAGTCGVKVGDGDLVPFTQALVFDGSTASGTTFNADGSVTYIATAAGGAGGGAAFYVKADKKEINIANYASVDIELVCSPITGKWKKGAGKPGFALRLLPYDSTGMFGGFEDVEYFDLGGDEDYGTLTKNVAIPETMSASFIDSCDFDAVLGFGLKFNDYGKGLTDGDQLKVQIKKITFNKKATATADKSFAEMDPLTAEQKGTVVEINYDTKDYVTKAAEDTYKKHAWVYLPAGYDAADTATKYPVFILLHGYGQNENTWGLSDKGLGGKIKGYMDRGMADGSVKPFILVCATGVASKNWGPNGAGMDFDGFNAFGGELRNDLLPYMRANYNIADGRENVALAGLSMGGGQTFNIGIGECLDLISYFGAFSAATFSSAAEFKAGVDGKAEFEGLKIKQLYMICGTADDLVIGGFNDFVPAMKEWDRIEKFDSETYEGGTHDFPVWFRGFKHLIPKLFK